MSEDEQRQLKALVLLEYTEAKQEAAMLREKLSQTGAFLAEIGALLQTDPHTYLYRGFSFPEKEKIDAMAKELDETMEKVRQSWKKAVSLGIPMPDPAA